jgi:cobyrinic acid a,c-diamide synthase
MSTPQLTVSVPRLMLAATGSGAGKTTLTCALLMAWQRQGLYLASFKCGPDFIDPMFHSTILGIPSRNLDVFLSGEEGVRFLLARKAAGHDLAVIEGVMGLYDGVVDSPGYASSNHLACLTQTPTLLVVNVQGMGHSVLALIKGFQTYAENTLAGILLNQCQPGRYADYKAAIESELGLDVYGYLPPLPEAEIGSRHLGLVTAGEIDDLTARLNRLGEAAAHSMDLEGLLRLARTAPMLQTADLWASLRIGQPRIRVGVARDKAFCFLYEDNLELLDRLDVERVEFSPLHDRELPPGLAGLILPGGYPELYGQQLSANQGLLAAIRSAVQRGLPVLAECGGFMYLMDSLEDLDGQANLMVGAIPGQSQMTRRLSRFGYLELTAEVDNLLTVRGETLRAHEFHYSDSTNNGSAFTARKRGREWPCMHAGDSMLAGYPHLHFAARPELAERFVESCRQYAQTAGGGQA